MMDIYLWAGLNQEGISDDEANGGGINTPLDLVPFQTSEVFRPLVEPPEFWDVCPDVVWSREYRRIEIPRELVEFRLVEEHVEITLQAEDRTVKVQAENTTIKVR